jgi:hypothetical protein
LLARWRRAESRTLQKVVEQRLTLLLDFEKIDQSLLLIGDWYSAQVYRLIVEQFFLNDWKSAVGLVQLVGWLILLVGILFCSLLIYGKK